MTGPGGGGTLPSQSATMRVGRKADWAMRAFRREQGQDGLPQKEGPRCHCPSWRLGPVTNLDGSDQFQRLINLDTNDSRQFDALEDIAGLAVDHN